MIAANDVLFPLNLLLNRGKFIFKLVQWRKINISQFKKIRIDIINIGMLIEEFSLTFPPLPELV